MKSEENVTVTGAILTKRIVHASIKEDMENVRSYIPRSQRIIAWMEANKDEIDNRKSGNIKISFRNDSLQIAEELFHQIS